MTIVLLDSACGEPARLQETTIRSEYDTTGRLKRLAYDRNGDGKVETWGYMAGARIERVEVDEDGDGKVDLWEYHRDAAPGTAAAGVDRTIERIDRATRHDGKISRRERFSDGALTEVEEDTDGNGTFDKWETYRGGALQVMALDTTGRGIPDRRLIYGPDGSLTRIETDPTGSGTFKALK